MTRNEDLVFALVSYFSTKQLEMIYAFVKPTEMLTPEEQLKTINELLQQAIAKKKGIWI